MGVQSDTAEIELDFESLSETVEEYPVRCAVLYGSHVHGTATADSDIDIAVAFETGLSEAERFDRRIALTAALIETLGTDTVDVADLDSIRPEVGHTAVNTGHLIVGDPQTIEEYRNQFEREATSPGTHEQRMEQFDTILDRLDEMV
jgi:predicted nucleotidyltransferase